VVSGAALSSILQNRAQTEVISKALVLLNTMTSVRQYTQDRVRNLLLPQLETEAAFIPETVPAFSATEVFENLRKNEQYQNFFYKEATLNPTNLRDKADTYEAAIVERFRKNPSLPEIASFRTLPEGTVFYIARPLAIKEQSCLQCHSTPEKAPKSQLVTYGSENGFGWQLNEIVAAQIISVPSEEVFNNAQSTWLGIMAFLVVIFAIVVIIINFLIKKTVIQRIRKIENIAQRVSTGDMSAEFEDKTNDEIGGLAAAFNRMKYSLTIAMDMLNKQNE
ncbi:c-type heme family protein, partial [Trichormus variabilis]